MKTQETTELATLEGAGYTVSSLRPVGGGLEVTLEWDSVDDDRPYTGSLIFQSVRAFRFRADAHALEWQLALAPNVLFEIRESTWVAELDAAHADPGTWLMRHFFIFLDDDGPYEFAAASWEQGNSSPA